jgi:hypothetical protein
MSETGSSALDLRLAKAQELIARGKQRRALFELWGAEVLARGNADAIRRMLGFTSAFEQRVEPRQKSRLADLVAALEHDARHATLSPAGPPLPPPGTPLRPQAEPIGGPAFYLGLVLSLLLAAGASAVIFFIWLLSATECSCPRNSLCILGEPATSGAGAHLDGAVGGLFYGGIGLLVLSGFMVVLFRKRLAHPFVLLIIGFPALYLVLLLSIWGVARGTWGPTACT